MPASTPDDALAALVRALDAAGDGGENLLSTLFRGRPPRGLRSHLASPGVLQAEAVWPLPSKVEIDPGQLAAFRAAHPDAAVPDNELASTKFQTNEDWKSYVVPGGISYHVTGAAVARPLYDQLAALPQALTHDLRPGQDPALHPLEIGLFADFGNATYQAAGIARQLAQAKLPYAMHLGDVYYAGTKKEFEDGFFYAREAGGFGGPLAPSLSDTELFMLSGNHEMYSDGVHFQQALLQKRNDFPALQRQQAEMFRLRGHGVQVIGIDTMWTDWAGKPFGRHHSRLGKVARDLLDAWLAEPHTLTILLTSDEPWDLSSKSCTPLLDDLEPYVRKGKIDLWFWGNVHYAAQYRRFQFPGCDQNGFIGACIGHGGYPFYTQKPGQKLPDGVTAAWVDTRPRFWPWTKIRPDVGLNGWVRMALSRRASGWEITLRWMDWVGREVARTLIAKPDGGPAAIAEMQKLVKKGGKLVFTAA